MFGSVRDVNPDRALMTVLFTDIVGSTEQAALLGDGRWRQLLIMHEQMLRREVEAAGGGRVVKLIGDGSLSTFDGPARAIRCAERICAAADELDVEIRAGLHTGECEVIDNDLAGIAVHIAARVSAQAGPGEVLVSRTVRDLVTGSGIALQSRGEHELKGVPGSWELFAVGSETAPLPAPDQTRQLRASDRVVLLAARRAPGLLRAASRIGTRRDHQTGP
jgi:class 3 adenylate cyclase